MEVDEVTPPYRTFSLLDWFKSKNLLNQTREESLQHRKDYIASSKTSATAATTSTISNASQSVSVFNSEGDDESAAPTPKKVREDYIEIIDSDSDNNAQPESVEGDLELSYEPVVTSSIPALNSSTPVSCLDNVVPMASPDVGLGDNLQHIESMSLEQDKDYQGASNFAISVQPLHSDIAAVATDSPVQPTNIRYPVTLYSNKPRSFNPDWFKLYPWLEYSVKEDACFCFPCRMFGGSGGVPTSRHQKTFTEIGFKSWKHACYRERWDSERP